MKLDELDNIPKMSVMNWLIDNGYFRMDREDDYWKNYNMDWVKRYGKKDKPLKLTTFLAA